MVAASFDPLANVELECTKSRKKGTGILFELYPRIVKTCFFAEILEVLRTKLRLGVVGRSSAIQTKNENTF